jgi:quinol-cytochrome oxidoreductase complex cytochrome b subunit
MLTICKHLFELVVRTHLAMAKAAFVWVMQHFFRGLAGGENARI